jgi:hypothetical protein
MPNSKNYHHKEETMTFFFELLALIQYEVHHRSLQQTDGGATAAVKSCFGSQGMYPPNTPITWQLLQHA